jgi:carbon monoxide dehydrogenase subunit G
VAVIENRVDIDRPQEEVFDYLVDLKNELEWNPGVESMEKISDGAVGLGTKYRAKWKQSGSIICECTRYDRPNAWTYVNGGPIEVTLDITLTPRGEGTTLMSRFDAHPKGVFRVVFPLFLMMMKRQEKANMVNAKSTLERR